MLHSMYISVCVDEKVPSRVFLHWKLSRKGQLSPLSIYGSRYYALLLDTCVACQLVTLHHLRLQPIFVIFMQITFQWGIALGIGSVKYDQQIKKLQYFNALEKRVYWDVRRHKKCWDWNLSQELLLSLPERKFESLHISGGFLPSRGWLHKAAQWKVQ